MHYSRIYGEGTEFFHDEWQAAVAKENVYTPFFFPWYKDRRMFVDEYKEFSEMYKARNGKYLTEDELDEEEQWLFEKVRQ